MSNAPDARARSLARITARRVAVSDTKAPPRPVYPRSSA